MWSIYAECRAEAIVNQIAERCLPHVSRSFVIRFLSLPKIVA